MSSDLKPCPNPECGAGAEMLERWHDGEHHWPEVWGVECLGCGTSGPRGRSESEGDRLWNALPAPADMEGALRECAQGFVHALEMIEVDLEAGDMPAKTRVKLALSRTKAWLETARARAPLRESNDGN